MDPQPAPSADAHRRRAWSRNGSCEIRGRTVAGTRSRASCAARCCPSLGSRPIAEVRKRDLIAMVEGVVDRGSPVMANRVLAHIKRLFRWAAGRDLIETDPAAHIEKPTPERSRDRVLTDGELIAVWRAAETMGGPFGAGVRLLIATGARREEVFGLRRAELGAMAIRLPAERSKNKEPRIIPLSPLALSVLAELPCRRRVRRQLTGERPFTNITPQQGRARTPAAGVAAAVAASRPAPDRRDRPAAPGRAAGGDRGGARARLRQPKRHRRRLPAPPVRGRGARGAGRLGRARAAAARRWTSAEVVPLRRA